MEGHWGTPKAESRIKLEAQSPECFLSKEHLLRTFAGARQLCASRTRAYRSNGCGLKVASFAGRSCLNLYLDCVNLQRVLIVSELCSGFAEHQGEQVRAQEYRAFAGGSMSLAEARSFDMEHLERGQ